MFDQLTSYNRIILKIMRGKAYCTTISNIHNIGFLISHTWSIQ